MTGFLTQLFKRGGTSAAAAVARIPEGMRVYAVGDVHGRKDLLEDLMAQIKEDARGFRGKITLLFVGDYIDRGPDSAGVVDVLVNDLPKDWNVVALRGNHEEALAWFLADPASKPDWLHWGGIQALESYGVKPYGTHGMRDVHALAAELDHALRECGHRDFLLTRPLHHVVGDYLFVHAGVRPGLALKDQMADDLLFIREDFIGRAHGLPYRVVFGHTILSGVLIEADKIGLDTGAFVSGQLSCVALQDDTVRILATGNG